MIILFLLNLCFAEVSGHLEAQGRMTQNSDLAYDDLNQKWHTENFSLLAGSLQTDHYYKNFSFETGVIARYTYSDLYKAPYLAANSINFPSGLISRNLFQSEYTFQGDYAYTQASFNQFMLSYSGELLRLSLGRIPIYYGVGEVFNPINPFSSPLGLMTQQAFTQGSDGLKVSYFITSELTLEYFQLYDRTQEEGRIHETIWGGVDYRGLNPFEIQLWGGRDQQRNKIGTQVSATFEEALLFTQLMYESALLNPAIPSEHKLSALIGIDRQLSTSWHLRSEFAYQRLDEKAPASLNTQVSQSFIPSEQFWAIALGLEPESNPLWEHHFTWVHDVKTSLGLALLKSSHSLRENLDIFAFILTPIYRSDRLTNDQKLVTQDLGAGIRYFF